MAVVSKDQVKELLGTGLSVSVVASAVGCADGYITQLMSDADFASEVTRLKIINLQASSKRDDSINGIEDKILRKLTSAIDENAFYRPRDLLHAFAVINNAKRRGVAATSDSNIAAGTTIINLNIPATVAKKFTISQQGEVLEVDDQTLITMPTGQLLSSLAKGEGERSRGYQQVRNKLLVDLRSSEGENK
jgi:hypothetical protein